MPQASEPRLDRTEVDRYALDAMILARCRRPIGHEMKNAVQGLYSGIEILSKVIEPGAKAKVSGTECIALLRRQLDGLQQRLMHILDDVAPAHTGPFNFDLCALVQDVARFLTSDAAVAGTRIQLALPEECTVFARPATLRRLVLGLCFDAIDSRRCNTLAVSVVPLENGVELKFSESGQHTERGPASSSQRIDGGYLRQLTKALIESDGGECAFSGSETNCNTQIKLRAASAQLTSAP